MCVQRGLGWANCYSSAPRSGGNSRSPPAGAACWAAGFRYFSGPWPFALIAAQRQTEGADLLAYLVERGHAEILRFEQLIGGALHQLAERGDAEAVHALAGAHR